MFQGKWDYSVMPFNIAGGLCDVVNRVGFDGMHSTNSTPMCSSLSRSKPCYSFASPALQKWLCSPNSDKEVTPKISNNQVLFCILNIISWPCVVCT